MGNFEKWNNELQSLYGDLATNAWNYEQNSGIKKTWQR